MKTQDLSYRGYRFPPEIISYAVWLYHRFSFSFRDVEELLAERGVTVSYEAIRLWCLRGIVKLRLTKCEIIQSRVFIEILITTY
jgi:transposase-like protein